MGLFDKVLPSAPGKLSPSEGLVGIAVAAIAADGVITPEEVQGLAVSLGRTRAFQGSNTKQVQQAFERVAKVAREKGPEELMRLCSEALPRELKPTAFAIAADLLFADGDVSGTEKAYLERIQKTLEVQDDLALKIVEVMGIKNRA